MSSFKCAVKTCANYFISYAVRDRYPYKFHAFPKDKQIVQIWKTKCGIRNDFDVSKLLVCSDHFYLDDYQRNYKEEFVNPNYKRELKPDAVPSKNLMEYPEPSQSKRVKTLPTEHSYHHGNKTEALDKELVKETVDKHEFLKSKLKDSISKYQNLKKKCSTLQRGTEQYKKRLQTQKRAIVEITDVQKVFSPSQIKLLLGYKKVHWTDDDLARAFTLRHIGGRNCYLYLKNTLNMPLPALSCVQRWASSVSPST